MVFEQTGYYLAPFWGEHLRYPKPLDALGYKNTTVRNLSNYHLNLIPLPDPDK